MLGRRSSEVSGKSLCLLGMRWPHHWAAALVKCKQHFAEALLKVLGTSLGCCRSGTVFFWDLGLINHLFLVSIEQGE